MKWADGGRARFDNEVRLYGIEWASEVHRRREALRMEQLSIPTAKAKPNKAEPTFRCEGCGNYYPTAQRRIIGGKAFCSSYGCVQDEKRMPTADEVRRRHEAQFEYQKALSQCFVCPGCNVRIPECHAQHHPHTSKAYCGGEECYYRLGLMKH